MIFAVIAITPFKTQGIFTESEIREKKGNLLYYGNFHGMDLRDFEWGMLEMLNDGNFLYSTGANEFAGRFTKGHFDLPVRGCTISLDGVNVVEDGELAGSTS